MEKNKTIVLDRGNYTTCTVNLQGATVTSWRIQNQEQLYMSRQSHSHELSHIIGGIQLVFPYFGLWNFGPKYGFARSLPWVLEEGPKRLETEDIFAAFTLFDDAYTHALWGYKFKLVYKITLSKCKLSFRIAVENLCNHFPFEFHLTQHCLFRVPNVHKCQITVLHSGSLEGFDENVENISNDLEDTSGGYSNKIYRNVRSVVIKNLINGGVLKIEQKRHASNFRVWNPGPENSSALPDLDSEEYKRFIVVGAGTVLNSVRLESQTCWSTIHSFEFSEGEHFNKRKKHPVKHFFDYFKGYC